MKKKKIIVAVVAFILAFVSVLHRLVPVMAEATVSHTVAERELRPAKGIEKIAASAGITDRSGYWVSVTQKASIRRFPGGAEVRPGFRLSPGQYFHLDPQGGNAQWALGFACPNGGRYCNSRENLQGFILRCSLGNRVSVNSSADLTAGTVLASSDAAKRGDTQVAGALYLHALSSVNAASLALDSERHVCARDIWLRDDRLHPIGLLHQGDRFVVERYTNGSGNKYDVWAIGRAYGPGVNPQGKRGRLMAKYLCQ